VTNAYVTVQTVMVSSTNATVVFTGVPTFAYEVQRSTNLLSWSTLLITNTPPGGVFDFVDNFSDLGAPPSQAYYRLKQD
jgi:hypothetical protein